VYATAFFAVVVAAIVTSLLVRKNPQFRRITSQLMLGTPTIGKIVNKVYMARFCQNMALLLGSKTPLLKSLGMVRNMIGFYPYEKALETIESDVLHGMLLNQSMQKFKFFDKRLLALTRVAEEVNQLDNIFGKLSVQYSEELEHEINIIGNILEPALIIFVGALVAIILISMYLPLFQLSSSIA
jgi:type IV pilus assembly protein PilC